MGKVSYTKDGNEAVNICNTHLRRWEDGVMVLHTDDVWVVGTPKDIGNTEFIAANNIKSIYFDTGGGCIICFPDDLGILHFSTDYDDNFSVVVTEKVIVYLISKGLNVTQDGNDVLIDGYKVFSTGRVNYNQRVVMTAIHVSINCDAELVDKICLKPMHKKPIGLSEYGITSNEILELILNEYNNGE